MAIIDEVIKAFELPTCRKRTDRLYEMGLIVAFDDSCGLDTITRDFLRQLRIYDSANQLSLSLNDDGLFFYAYNNRKVLIPTARIPEDMHQILRSLNKALMPDYEIRYDISSHLVDLGSFALMPSSYWDQLVKQFGEQVHACFYRIAERPDLFNEGGYCFTDAGMIEYFKT
jgi:hypothetical protein